MECINLIFDDTNEILRGERKGVFATNVARPYRDIHEYQLFTENHTDVGSSRGFGLGRAIVGGAVAGPLGAVLVGLTKKNITSNSYTTCTVAISFNYSESISVTTTFDKAMDYMRSLDQAYQKVHGDEVPQISQNNVEIEALQKQISDLTESLNNKEEPIVINSSADTDSLIKRAFSFLENNEWKKAEAYAESALDIEPERAEAYLVKLMVDLQVSIPDELSAQSDSFEENPNYKKALQYADSELSSKMIYYITEIKCSPIYKEAKQLFDHAQSPRDYEESKKLFCQIPEYADSSVYIEKCKTQKTEFIERKYTYLVKQMNSALIKQMNLADRESKYSELAKKFKELSSYKNVSADIEECEKQAQICKFDALYSDAIKEIKEDTIGSLNKAKDYLEQCIEWKDSERLLSEANNRIEEIEKQNEQKERQKRKKTIKKVCVQCTIAVFIITTFAGLIYYFNSDYHYAKIANEAINSDRYEEAFDACSLVSDAAKKDELYVKMFDKAFKNDRYEEAFDACSLVSDAAKKDKLCVKMFDKAFENDRYKEAFDACSLISDTNKKQKIYIEMVKKSRSHDDRFKVFYPAIKGLYIETRMKIDKLIQISGCSKKTVSNIVSGKWGLLP